MRYQWFNLVSEIDFEGFASRLLTHKNSASSSWQLRLGHRNLSLLQAELRRYRQAPEEQERSMYPIAPDDSFAFCVESSPMMTLEVRESTQNLSTFLTNLGAIFQFRVAFDPLKCALPSWISYLSALLGPVTTTALTCTGVLNGVPLRIRGKHPRIEERFGQIDAFSNLTWEKAGVQFFLDDKLVSCDLLLNGGAVVHKASSPQQAERLRTALRTSLIQGAYESQV